MLGGTLAATVTAWAAEPVTATATSEAASRLARTTTEFWNLATENPDTDLAYDIECDVLYYNPFWTIMWIDSGAKGEYADPGPGPRPYQSGDRVRFTGVIPAPVTALTFAHATATVVGRGHPTAHPLPETESGFDALRNSLVTVDAWVDKQDIIDQDFIRLTLSRQGRTMTANVTWKANGLTDGLVDRRVRIEGVFAPRQDPAGQITELQLMVPGVESIEVLGDVATDPAFTAARVSIDSLANLPSGQAVLLRGRVVDQNVGRTLTIRDESSQLTLTTEQVRYVNAGETVEVVGEVDHTKALATLRRVAFRAIPPVSADRASPTANRYFLNLAARVRELPEAELTREHQATLRGVVTWSDPDSTTFFVADASGGIEIDRTPAMPHVDPGSFVEVRGVVRAGDFAPIIHANRLTAIGTLSYPLGREVSLERALTGSEDAQWVTMRGYVFDVSRNDGTCTLQLSTTEGDFAVEVSSRRNRRDLLHSVVEVVGVCRARANSQRQLETIDLLVPDETLLNSIDSPPADPFALAELPVSRLGRFNPGANVLNFVNIAGTVLYHQPGRWLYLADGEEVIRVHTRETKRLPRGRHLEVAGRLGRDQGEIVLREALLRSRGEAPLPASVEIAPDSTDLSGLAGHLATFTGTLINLLETKDRIRYTVQQGSLVMEAELAHDHHDFPNDAFAHPSNGSTLRLTGVLVPTSEGTRSSAAGYVLQLAEPADVALLHDAPWWTSRRLTQAALLLVLVLSLGIIWVRVLRRRVRHQTALLKRQMAREARLSEQLQDATRLESLGLLAGGIAHDFNNLLTVVLGNLSLLRLDLPTGHECEESVADAEKAVRRAQQLTLQLLTFSKGGSPVCNAEDLPGIVNEVTEFALHGSGVCCDTRVAPDLWAAHVDKGQISQVVQNLVINAQQAMGGEGRLDLRLTNVSDFAELPPTLPEGRFVRLEVRDTGCGIPEDKIKRIFDPYFSTKHDGHGLGLATVYSIVRKHHGDIAVTSQPGRGTTFTVWLPAARGTSQSGTPFAAKKLPPRGHGQRILVMDDEASIRALATKMLLQLNYEPVAVPDGDAAIETFTAAQANGHPFAAVILDLTIRGGMGGADTLKQLRLQQPDLRAIVSSGYSSDQAIAAHQELGFDDLIPKPYELENFATTLANLLARRSTPPAEAAAAR